MGLNFDPVKESLDTVVSDENVAVGSNSSVGIDKVVHSIKFKNLELRLLVANNGDRIRSVLIDEINKV